MKFPNSFRAWGAVGILAGLLLFPQSLPAQQRGPSWIDAARTYQDHLQECNGLRLSTLINAQFQGFLQSPRHEGAGRSSAYYWAQANQSLWTGACVVVELEGGWGAGLDRLVETYSIFNGNSGEPSTLYVPKLYLSQNLLEERMVLYAGKLDLSSWFDLNDAANSSDLQFLSSALVYNLAIPFPEKGLGLMAGFKPAEGLYVQAGLADASAVSTHTGFDTAFEPDARTFSIAELDLCPVIQDQPGHYRFMLWNDQRTQARFDEQGEEAGHCGGALSFDQALNQMLTLFCRYGYADPAVYPIEHFWSCGAQLKAILPRRPDDVFGLGLAQSILSQDFRRHSDPRPASAETLYEAYYLIALNEFLGITPVLQWVQHPLGEEDDVMTGGARMVLAF